MSVERFWRRGSGLGVGCVASWVCGGLLSDLQGGGRGDLYLCCRRQAVKPVRPVRPVLPCPAQPPARHRHADDEGDQHDVPRDLDRPVQQVSNIYQRQQCLPSHRLNRPSLLIRRSHQLLPPHQGKVSHVRMQPLTTTT